jgi:hypothetical protein
MDEDAEFDIIQRLFDAIANRESAEVQRILDNSPALLEARYGEVRHVH